MLDLIKDIPLIDRIRIAERQFYDTIKEYFGVDTRDCKTLIMDNINFWTQAGELKNIGHIAFEHKGEYIPRMHGINVKGKWPSNDDKYFMVYTTYCGELVYMVFEYAKEKKEMETYVYRKHDAEARERTVEAVQFLANSTEEASQFLKNHNLPDWLIDNVQHSSDQSKNYIVIYIPLESGIDYPLRKGDYLVKFNNETYLPLNSEKFHKTFKLREDIPLHD